MARSDLLSSSCGGTVLSAADANSLPKQRFKEFQRDSVHLSRSRRTIRFVHEHDSQSRPFGTHPAFMIEFIAILHETSRRSRTCSPGSQLGGPVCISIAHLAWWQQRNGSWGLMLLGIETHETLPTVLAFVCRRERLIQRVRLIDRVRRCRAPWDRRVPIGSNRCVPSHLDRWLTGDGDPAFIAVG